MLAGVTEAERGKKHTGPRAIDPQGLAGSPPVHRARRQEARQPPVQPGLAPVTRAAEPLQVLQCERPSEGLGLKRPGDVDREPVVQPEWLLPTPAAA